MVDGEIPRELAGSYFRNGPNPQFAPRGRYHWFDGDGMIHAFRIRDGRASYKNRWVRTARWSLERAAGQSLFGGLSDMGNNDPRVGSNTFAVGIRRRGGGSMDASNHRENHP